MYIVTLYNKKIPLDTLTNINNEQYICLSVYSSLLMLVNKNNCSLLVHVTLALHYKKMI